MSRDVYNQQSLGRSLNQTVKEARVLMVGAGGIGCELLKNLVLAGFGEIHIVDLDTIDLSNLNRQFLFRHEHIKKSKALVAKEVAEKFNPNVKLVAHHGNIKDAEFSVEWFSSFVLVFNALDNLDARRHVNKMCLAADIPLIESGTTGFNGQVQVIKKGKTACYDCTVKETPKSFPVCTIRSTPSQPIHCIVWAKSYLLTEVFGASEEESSDLDTTEDSENAAEIAKLREEAQALKKIREAMGTSPFPQKLFDKVFKDDIERLRSMEDMWKSRKPPQVLNYATTLVEGAGESVAKETIAKVDQRPWTLEENLAVFVDSLDRLSKRFKALQEASNGSSANPIITFDKDDEDTLDFVTASANLRSIAFHIETKSKFDVKQMAGNIIPAIATTNAITAGLCVLEAYKVMKGDYSTAREVFLSPFTSERLLASDKPRPPNPDCPVCSPAQTRLLVDLSKATLHDLVEDFLRLELGYGEEFVVNNEIGTLYDVDETENLPKKLADLGIKDQSFLTIIDEDDDNPRVNLVLTIKDSPVEAEEKSIRQIQTAEQPEGEKVSFDIPRRAKPAVDTTNDEVNGSATNGTEVGDQSKKRTASEVTGLEQPGSVKRGKLTQSGTDDDLIVLDDFDQAIVIED